MAGISAAVVKPTHQATNATNKRTHQPIHPADHVEQRRGGTAQGGASGLLHRAVIAVVGGRPPDAAGLLGPGAQAGDSARVAGPKGSGILGPPCWMYNGLFWYKWVISAVYMFRHSVIVGTSGSMDQFIPVST